MLADVYRTGARDMFLLVPRGATLKGVPEEVLVECGDPVFLNTRDISDPLLGVDGTAIGSELTSQGFSIVERTT
jgi:hypothetical protein